MHFLPRPGDQMPVQIKQQLPAVQPFRPASPAEQRLNPGLKDPRGKGFGHIVVGAAFKAPQCAGFVVKDSQHQNRRVRPGFECLAEGKAAAVRQLYVQQDQIKGLRFQQHFRPGTAFGRGQGVPG